jgi:NAD(P)-dependent dehydrogenase (short-subunit alcohol dehydrogenase family)
MTETGSADLDRLLQGKVALVTGAGQGIGRGMALALGKAGAALAIADLDGGRATSVVEELRTIGVDAEPFTCDVGDRGQVEATVAAIIDRFGRFDILVNNAQASRVGIRFEDTRDEDLHLAFNSGTWGTFYCMRAAFPHLRDAGNGRIINLASSSSTHGRPLHAAYAAAKEAIRGLTKVAANEWGVHGITVNVICPNAVTPAGEKFAREHPEAAQAALMQRAIRRRGDAEHDIGATVVFLAGPGAGFITGQTLHVNGGGVTVP